MSPTPTTSHNGMVRVASTISLLAGLWLFVSPWMYHAYTIPNAWNSWLIGAFVALLAAIRLSWPTENAWLSWFNCLLGVWTFASPWIFGYTGNMERFINSLCVGVVLFVVALRSATATPHQPAVIH